MTSCSRMKTGLITSLQSSLLTFSSLLQSRNLNTNSNPEEVQCQNRVECHLRLITYDKETPESSEEGIPELAVQVLSDEDNDAEVGIETITDEERGEDKEPGCGAG